jgi:hypothetical protein
MGRCWDCDCSYEHLPIVVVENQSHPDMYKTKRRKRTSMMAWCQPKSRGEQTSDIGIHVRMWTARVSTSFFRVLLTWWLKGGTVALIFRGKKYIKMAAHSWPKIRMVEWKTGWALKPFCELMVVGWLNQSKWSKCNIEWLTLWVHCYRQICCFGGGSQNSSKAQAVHFRLSYTNRFGACSCTLHKMYYIIFYV